MEFGRQVATRTCAPYAASSICTVAVALLIGLVALLAPSQAEGARKTFKPVHAGNHVLVFRPHGLQAESIRHARVRLRAGDRRMRKRVRVKRVRRVVEAGAKLRVRKPAHVQHGRLKVATRRRIANPGPSPSPSPEPSPDTTSCEFGSFSAANLPGPCWRPYSDSSPFNRPIPSGAQLASNSSRIVSRITGFGPPQKILAGTADSEGDYGHPIYFSQPDDPVYTVHCTEDWGTCDIEGMQVRIPAPARPAGGGDRHMAVIDQAGGWEYDFWYVHDKPDGGGTIRIAWGGRTRIGTPDADGLGSNATAAHFGLAAGMIRPAEMEAGRINHALFMLVKCTNGTSVWPAGSGTGTNCSSLGISSENAPAMGQRFYLDMSAAQIDALGVPDWQRTILRAMAEYGMYVGDTGGSSWGLLLESGSSYTSFGHKDPWESFSRKIGAGPWEGAYTWDISDAADWRSKLRVAAPCVAQGC